MNNHDLNERLRDLRQTLPHGSLFQYRLADDSLYIEKLTIPGHARGAGTTFMTAVLQAADEAELPVELHARATGRSCDPSQHDLQRWYAGLGFEPLEEEDDGFDAAIKIRDVELLVRRVQVIVWQAESHHYAGNLQVLLEVGDDGDRPA